MVHSDSASPMKTTASLSPHLTIAATAHPLVPPSGGSTDQDQKQTPTEPAIKDLTSDSAQPSTPDPADAQPPAKNTTKTLSTSSSPSFRHTTEPSTPEQGPINGRTSGRKRTPKSCDCCGPNSAGHNVGTQGKGRGRRRGRGTDGDLGDIPKKRGGKLTHIRNFELTKNKVDESEDGDDTQQKVQCVATADTQSQSPVSVISQDGPLKICIAPQKREDASVEHSGVVGAVEKGGVDRRDLDTITVCSGAVAVRGRGRGMIKAAFPSKTEFNVEINSGNKGDVISSRTGALTRPAQKIKENRDSQLHHGDQKEPGSVECLFGNGDTVNLSDTEVEMVDSIIVSESEDGILSISLMKHPASSLRPSKDVDSVMLVDQISDGTDQGASPVTPSNESITSPDCDQKSSSMEVETCPPATVSPPDHGPITVSSINDCWALTDHKIYCQPGTWAKDEMEESLMKKRMDIDARKEASLDQLADTVHEFLEDFYLKYGSFIPLSETDVLEHLKKKGNTDFCNSGLDIKGEMSRYRAGLASVPIAGFMVMYNKHTLSLEDLCTLEEQNWLNDQIINMYGELIMDATEHKVHFFNSFFHKQLVAKGYDGVKRWTKKVDLFSKWLLLIPIHLEIHWSLVTVTMATKTISYYDSQGIVFRHTTDNIMKYLQSEAREKKQAAFQKGWKITIIKGIPQQKNDSDCGVFVLEYCRRLSVKQPLLFSQDDMPHIRKRIYKELCDCHLNN
ncbi:sentrin-specific protease 5-like [Cololabis saira]|uniref:sentrin-specific protease 5-like n=1 Tax=Cololabis saira TaxID=129043 RepID=UPI002AD26B97|nr:sentrin-specific protease 5-like [Cololabis saira]